MVAAPPLLPVSFFRVNSLEDLLTKSPNCPQNIQIFCQFVRPVQGDPNKLKQNLLNFFLPFNDGAQIF